MKEQYKKIISKIKEAFARSDLKESSQHATRDWLIALFVGVVITCALCVVGLYLFFFHYSGEMEDGVDPVVTKTFDSKKLHTLAEEYEKEKALFDTLRTSPASAPSPGINTVTQPTEESLPDQEDDQQEDAIPIPT